MAKVRILQYPDPRLRVPAVRVAHFDDAFQQTVDCMFETLYNSKNCAALAANQLDFPGPIPFVTVIDFSEKKDQPLCLVNAEISNERGKTFLEEGCMSVAGGIYEKVSRAEKITINAQDRFGKALTLEADGFLAKCVQHEIDHLHGVLFVDYLSPLKRRFIDRKVAKALKQLSRAA